MKTRFDLERDQALIVSDHLFVLFVFVRLHSTGMEEMFDKVQEFITSLSKFSDGENHRLSEGVSTNQVQSNCQRKFWHILVSQKLLQKHFDQVFWNKHNSPMNVSIFFF